MIPVLINERLNDTVQSLDVLAEIRILIQDEDDLPVLRQLEKIFKYLFDRAESEPWQIQSFRYHFAYPFDVAFLCNLSALIIDAGSPGVFQGLLDQFALANSASSVDQSHAHQIRLHQCLKSG